MARAHRGAGGPQPEPDLPVRGPAGPRSAAGRRDRRLPGGSGGGGGSSRSRPRAGAKWGSRSRTTGWASWRRLASASSAASSARTRTLPRAWRGPAWASPWCGRRWSPSAGGCGPTSSARGKRCSRSPRPPAARATRPGGAAARRRLPLRSRALRAASLRNGGERRRQQLHCRWGGPPGVNLDTSSFKTVTLRTMRTGRSPRGRAPFRTCSPVHTEGDAVSGRVSTHCGSGGPASWTAPRPRGSHSSGV